MKKVIGSLLVCLCTSTICMDKEYHAVIKEILDESRVLLEESEQEHKAWISEQKKLYPPQKAQRSAKKRSAIPALCIICEKLKPRKHFPTHGALTFWCTSAACSQKFLTKTELQQHLLTHRFPCRGCYRSYDTSTKYINHYRKIHTRHVFFCPDPLCNEAFRREDERFAHEAEKHFLKHCYDVTDLSALEL